MDCFYESPGRWVQRPAQCGLSSRNIQPQTVLVLATSCALYYKRVVLLLRRDRPTGSRLTRVLSSLVFTWLRNSHDAGNCLSTPANPCLRPLRHTSPFKKSTALSPVAFSQSSKHQHQAKVCSRLQALHTITPHYSNDHGRRATYLQELCFRWGPTACFCIFCRVHHGSSRTPNTAVRV